MEIARKPHEVNARLHHLYEDSLVNTLFGTWMQLADLAEPELKRHVKQENISRSTFYWQVKKLRDANVTRDAADVKILQCATAISAGFSLARNSSCRLIGKRLKVVQALAPFHVAAS